MTKIKMVEQNKEEAKLVEVPTQTTIAFQIGDNILSPNELLLKIYNDLQQLKKAL